MHTKKCAFEADLLLFRVVPKFGNFCSSLWAGDSSSTFAALLLACKVFILGWMEKNLQPRPRRSPPVLEEWVNCVLENFLCSSSRQQPPNILHAYICLTLVMLARRFYFQEKMGGSSRFWMNGGLFTCFSVVALGHIGGSRTQKHETTMEQLLLRSGFVENEWLFSPHDSKSEARETVFLQQVNMLLDNICG